MGAYYIAYDLGSSPSLSHYGIKGQKHGVRRWQNYDGSLTPAGRVHYGVGPARAARAETPKSAGRGAKSQEGIVSKLKNPEERAAAKEARAEAKAARAAQKEEAKAARQAAKEQKKAEKQAALDMEKQLAEERERKIQEDKKEALRQYIRHNPTEISKYTDAFTQDEMNDLISQMNFDERVKNIGKNARDKKLDQYQQYANRVVNAMQSVKNGSETAVAIYNTTSSIWNAVGKAKAEKEGKEFKPLPRIGGDKNKENNSQPGDKAKQQQPQNNPKNEGNNTQNQPKEDKGNSGNQNSGGNQQNAGVEQKSKKQQKREAREARQQQQAAEAEKIRQEVRDEVKRDTNPAANVVDGIMREADKRIKRYVNGSEEDRKKILDELKAFEDLIKG